MAEITYQDVLDFWQEKKIQTSDDLREAGKGQAITLAYHNTKLEDSSVTFHDTRDIFETGRVVEYTGEVQTLCALQNAWRSWKIFLESFENRRPLDENLVKTFHFALTEGTYDAKRYFRGERPGEYKEWNYITGRFEIGAPPEDVPVEMKELLEDMKEGSVQKALTAAAFFHAKFENIHAFADGNGRVGRLLMNYFLICHGHPLIIIHAEDRKQYLKALEQWDSVQELSLLKTFLKEQTVKTWERFMT